MFKLALVPDQQGYTFGEYASVIRSEVVGGPSRYRCDILDADIIVECQFTLDQTKHQYLRAFYNYINKGSDEFLIDLIIETATLREHVAKFQPGSFRLNNVIGGARYVTRVNLEVNRDVSGLNFDAIVAAATGDIVPGTYTTGIHHLKLLPSQTSYEVSAPNALIQSSVSKAPANISRLEKRDSEIHVKMQFDCDAADYAYLRALYNRVMYRGEGLFVNIVAEDNQVRVHYGHVTPGTFKLSSIKGGMFLVRWEMDILPIEGSIDDVLLRQTWESEPYVSPVYPGDMNLDTPWVDP